MKYHGKVFILDDDEVILSMLSRALKKEGYEIYSEGGTEDVVNRIKSWAPDILLLDVTLPGRNGMDILQEIKSGESGIDTEVVMLTADDTAETAVKAMKLGAADYVTKPFSAAEVKIVIGKIMEKKSLTEEVMYLRKAFSNFFDRKIVGESIAIKELLAKIQKMAEARVSTILVTGESGTGKEVVSRYVHDAMFGFDTARHPPFVSISCAAMPENLLESELFGYEKGSFTDAKSHRKGLFEQATGGTVLLDEIGDMKLDLQTKLLRVLEERTIRRIGGKGEIPVNVVAIATTNRNLSEAVETGRFRRDLFFRLSAFYLHIVPLRERKDDIPLLAKHFLSDFARKYNKKRIKGFSPEAEELLTAYSWPGNVRELKNLVERFVVLEDSEIILLEHMPNWIFGESIGTKQPRDDRFLLPESGILLEELEKDLIIQALERTGNNKAQAAKLLGVSYDSIRYQLKKFGLA
jgi:DNA-binding NtrC family response regulator